MEKKTESHAVLKVELYGFLSFIEREVFMGFRAKDEVIYSRVNGSTKREFDNQMAESGYKNSSDFVDYLLRVNKGKQVDGVTLKEFTDVMKEVAYELKKQGVNINQMARYINMYPDLATASSFQFYERAYRKLEDKILELLEKVA
ncbi:MAG: hypothetical protein IJP06_05255 [Agathobacter sp.]|nr:hypothetical protein [Agathobacter sp.]